MAKKITRKSTRKSVTISANCFGEEVKVKTKKKCIGEPVLDDKKCQACINHPTSLVPLVCLCKAGMDKVNKKAAVVGDLDIVQKANAEETAKMKFAGKTQNRVCGKRGARNEWGHYEGTIGATLDELIQLARFTKKELVKMAGTKMSKVNSHIYHLRKEKGINIVAPRGGIVSVKVEN